MKDWERKLYVLTRDPFYLGAVCAAIIFVGLIGAAIAGFTRPLDPPQVDRQQNFSLPEGTPFGMRLEWLAVSLNDTSLSFSEKLSYIRTAVETMPAEAYQDAAQIVGNSNLTPEEFRWADQLMQAVMLNERQPPSHLLEQAQQEPPLRYAALVVGQIYRADMKRQTAAEYFELEGRRFEDASHARKLALQNYVQTKQFGKVEELIQEPLFQEVTTPNFMLDLAGKKQDWAQVFTLLIQTQFNYREYTYVALAVFSMLIWLAFCIQAGQIKSATSLTFWLCLLAIPAGAFSTILTLFCSIYQEVVWGLVERSDAVGGLTYFIIGVGLREEVTKLIMFLPFVPFMLKRDNDLETLIVAACVGLGFAAEENIIYYQSSGALSAPTRFMTANFLHLALTGLLGLAFCRIFKNPKTGITDFIAMLTAVVLLHGLYNSFQAVPALQSLMIFTWTTFVGIGYMFFHELRKFRHPKREVFSLRATFLFGLSVLVSIALIMLAAQLGFMLAIQIVIPSILQMLLIVYMFIRELSDGT